MKEKIEVLWLKLKKDKKKTTMMIVLVGILLLVIVWPIDGKLDETQKMSITKESLDYNMQISDDDSAAYVDYQEKRLKNILSKIQGAGAVEVMITVSTSKEKIVEKDVEQMVSEVLETDSNGGSRTSKEKTLKENTLYEGGTSTSQETPYVIKELEPVIEGVVVAATGADSLKVVDEITSAINVLFDIPVHKIKVVKMEN